jgi:predicted DNA-binding transcriptional regulator YafY
LNFYSNYFIGYGEQAVIKEPVELISSIKETLQKILKQYD